MSRTTSDLPFGREFSSSQIDLPVVLELVKKNEGDRRAHEKVILRRYCSGHAKDRTGEENRKYNRRKLANNCKLGLMAYKTMRGSNLAIVMLDGASLAAIAIVEAFNREVRTAMKLKALEVLE